MRRVAEFWYSFSPFQAPAGLACAHRYERATAAGAIALREEREGNAKTLRLPVIRA